MKRWVPFAVVALAVTACQDASGPARHQPPSLRAPVFSKVNGIPDRYVVVFKEAAVTAANQGDVEQEMVGGNGGTLTYSYRHALNGFAAQLSPAAVSRLAQDPRVKYIEQDAIAHAISSGTQTSATWGIDRIDQRALPVNGTYTWSVSGVGVTAYIIDTGIRFDHSEFGPGTSRAVKGEDEITPGGTAADCNGHGTHVSGTVGGKTYGVARDVKLVAVRVLDCSGSGPYTAVIAGVEYVTKQKQANLTVPMVANMSLGGSPFQALDDAITASSNVGVTYAVAAGNDGLNACNYSPARTPAAITVGATDNTDTKTSWSNYGTCVDIFAPGNGITSSWYTTATATNTISGTSMASPHVAGVAALYLEANPNANAATVAGALTSNATAGVVKSPGTGSPNRLLYSVFGPPPPPVTNVSVSPATSTIVVGGTVQLTATTTPAGRPVTWTSGNTSVATVSATGLVTGKASSTTAVIITATSEGVTGTASVTVEPAPPVTAVSVAPGNSVIEVGQTVQLTATTTPSGRAVTWSSNNTAVATVDANGLVRGVSSSATAVTITATSEGKTGTATVTVNPATVTAITVSPTSATIAVGATRQLTATTTPAGRPVTWTSSAPGVATVSSTGLVRGVTAGSATITATSGGKSASSQITVTAACTDGNCQN